MMMVVSTQVAGLDKFDSFLTAPETGLLQQPPSPAHFSCCAGAPEQAGSHAALPNGILPANGHASPREPSESAPAAAGAQQSQTENGTSRTGAEPEDSRIETVRPSTLGLIVDLLCFCVQHHSFRIKYYTLRNNVVEKVGQSSVATPL